MSARAALTGFGNHFASEALPGALPQGRNSPRHPPYGLYAELLSGSAFTAPRALNRRTWMYRRLPSVVCGPFTALDHAGWLTGTGERRNTPPNPLRWGPPEGHDDPAQAQDFVEAMTTLVVAGDAQAQWGMAVHQAVIGRSMKQRALVNADGEFLIIPQRGALDLTTELGVLHLVPGDLALIPRGVVFRVDVAPQAEPAWVYVGENYGAAFTLPELGPIGSNGLANARDFEAPHAAFESDLNPDGAGPFELVKKDGGRLWRAQQAHSPFNVVAWHGNLVPMRYDTRHFNALGSVSFDHPDPSIFTVLTSASDTPGVANCDFVLFPPRWSVAQDTFRPPWYHRNVMSEFMGLVRGQYDAKPQGFVPGGASLHNRFVPHGPDAQAYAAGQQATDAPQRLDNTLAFMFESRWPMLPTPYALQSQRLDTQYADCWRGLRDRFNGTPGA
jgi:homogentisate 1,2-dioxygenase